MPKRTDTIILTLNHLDAEDFMPMLHASAYKQNMLVVADSNSIDASVQFPTASIRADFTEPADVINKLQGYLKTHASRFVGIIGLDEEYRYTIAQTVATEFRLPYQSRSCLSTITDKYLQIAALAQHNVSVPAYALVTQDTAQSTIAYPNVLKICSGIGSAFVYKNNNAHEFAQHLTYARAHKTQATFVIESYIGGVEYSCDYLVDMHGNATIVRVVQKITDVRQFPFFKGFYLCNPDIEPELGFTVSQLRDLCTNSARALGVTNAVCMMDFKLYDEKLYVIETTVRPGVSQFIELMIALYDYTTVDLRIKQIMQHPLPAVIPQQTGAVFYLTTTQEGVVTRFDFSQLSTTTKEYTVLSWCQYVQVGQKIERDTTKAYGQIMLGHVLITNVALSNLTTAITTVEQQIEIAIT